jgi:iron complex outermembrane receptor protein
MIGKIGLLTSASLIFVTSPALAQATPSSDQPTAVQDSSSLEEIIVTAQKREQNLQSVPVAVTALGAEAIANSRIADFSDLARAAPSLTITQTTTSPNNSIVLRGIGTFAFSIGVEPSVAVIIDDMPVVQQAQAFDNLADLERIEVLKGPQGTLFGKSASAGVVNIVTKDPDNQFSGMISATAATDGDYRVEGVVSVPLTDRAGLRVTGFWHDFQGNVRNLTSNTRLNDQQNYGVRAKFKGELTDTLSFTLTGAYSKATQDGTTSTLRGIFGSGTPIAGGAPLAPTLVGISPGAGNYRSRVDTLGATTNKTASIAGKINLDLGFADLISITAYQDWKYRFEYDFDFTDVSLFGPGTGGLAQRGPFHSTNLTEELRLVSSGSSALKYVVGGFYSDADTFRAFQRGPNTAVASWQATNGSKSLGLFAQLDYTLPTDTTISGGIRYNREKIGVAFDNLLGTATANQCAVGNPLCRGSNTDSVVTWKASVSQNLAPQVMAFASVARGYKGFAYDIVTGFNPARVNAALNGTAPGLTGVGPIKPETSTSYELGLKSRFLDNRIQFNLIGFYTDYNNFQAQSAILVGTPPAPQFVLNNVGTLRTKGLELEVQAKPTRWLRLDAGATYTDAVMTRFPNAQGYPGQTGALWNGTTSVLSSNCTSAAAATALTPRTTCSFQDRSGAQLPNSPKFKWSAAATTEFPLGDDTKGTFIVSYQHQSSVSFDLLGNPYLRQGAYGVMNASLGIAFNDIKVTAFVNNLFDKHYASSMADNFGLAGGSAGNDTHPIYQFLSRDSQRYAGLKVAMTF